MLQVWLLRTASLIALLQFVAHTALFISYTPARPAEVAVVEAMQSNRFTFSGSLHSYWDFYFGYGLFAASTCLIEAVLFWYLAAVVSRGSVRPVWPIVAVYCCANLAYAALIWKYFFLLPLYFDLAIAACLGLVLVGARGADRPAAARQGRLGIG